MRYFILSSIAILSVGLLPTLPSILIVIVIIIGCACAYKRNIAGLSISTGLMFGLICGQLTLAQQLPHHIEDKSFEVVGVVKGIPVIEEHKVKFLFDIESSKKFNFTKKVSLSIYFNASIDNSIIKNISPGKRWYFYVKLRRPRGFFNPFGFDYQLYLIKKRYAQQVMSYLENL